MGIYAPRRTYSDPAASQSGQPSIGAGAQTVGPYTPAPGRIPWFPERWVKGLRSFLHPSGPAGGQRGFPAPLNAAQRRPAGSMPNEPPIFGGVFMKYVPPYDYGAAAYSPNFGKVLVNPIGAGINAGYRPQASYGLSGQYANGAIWWTSQVIPTSINLQGLTDPEELGALLSELEVQAVVRTTG